MALPFYEITRWQTEAPLYYQVSGETMQNLAMLTYALNKLYNRFLEEDETNPEDVILLRLLVRQVDFIICQIDTLHEHNIAPSASPPILVKE